MLFDKLLTEHGYFVLELTARNVKNIISALPRHHVLAICDHGEIEIQNNMQRLHITTGTRLLVSQVVQYECITVSADFHGWAIGVTEDFARNTAVGIPAEMIMPLFRYPVRTIKNRDEWVMLVNFFANIRIYDNMEGSQHSPEMAGAILRCMLLAMAEIEIRDYPKESSVTNYSMADSYFLDFLNLVSQHVDTEHEVAFYAEKLKITPKYLSKVCGMKAQHKAKEIIAGILISRIKREILVGNASMKQLSHRFGFADQSSLGKFFRKMTGQSPTDYRVTMQQKNHIPIFSSAQIGK